MGSEPRTESSEPPSGRPLRSPASLPDARLIPRLSGSEAQAYLRQLVLPELPVVFTDVMHRVPAMSKWTPAFFKGLYGQLPVEVAGRTVTLSEQLRLIEGSTEECPAPYPYSFSITDRAPELMADLAPFVSFGRSDRTVHPLMPRTLLNGTVVHELFFGGRGAGFPTLHYDLLGMSTQITQIAGDKEFFLFDPSHTPLLYPTAISPRTSAINNIFAPDLERFPLFRQACPTRVLLREGETLYFPAGWWHLTRIHGPSITYGRAVVNASNWRLMMRENLGRWRGSRPLMAVPGYLFGTAVGLLFNMMEAVG